jgi:hypothetical protein
LIDAHEGFEQRNCKPVVRAKKIETIIIDNNKKQIFAFFLHLPQAELEPLIFRNVG